MAAMEISILSNGTKTPFDLGTDAFDMDFNEALVHQVFVAEQNALRAGTKAQKNRSMVRGGGRKPWKQKGSGRARAGTSRSPIWRKGGVTFAAIPRNYEQKVNRKMRLGATCSLLSELMRRGVISICDEFVPENPRTKELCESLKKNNIQNVMLVTDSVNENLYLSSRNLYNVSATTVNDINVLNLLQHENILFTQSAIQILIKRFSNE